MRVLVLSSVYPNAAQPLFGVFVHQRVQRMTERCEVVVVAPVPWFPLSGAVRGRARMAVPARETLDGVNVLHPRFLSVPGILKSLDGLLYFVSLLPALRRLRRRFPFDVIDAHFAYPDGLAAWLLGRVLGCPVTITLRGTIVRLAREPLLRWQLGCALRGVGLVFAVSESLKTVAVGLGIDPGKIRVIPNGVDGARFRPGAAAAARARLGLPPERPIVVSVGSLAPRKGHQRVLQALPAVIAQRPDVLYVAVGGPGVEGDTGPVLRRMIGEGGLQGHVRLVGARPHEEIPAWLAAADVFCLATSNEGRANVILEALACGRPVVTTDLAPNREVVEPGVNGLLVPLDDASALAQALVRALQHPWDREAIARRAGGRGWEQVAADVLDELGRLAAAPPPRAPRELPSRTG
jgi:glycosyltransferase involved in cell wall biosynthesis